MTSPHEDALALVMTRGWPGSIVEFLDVIDPRGRAEDAFHLVLPSIPGYGFSDKPAETGWTHRRTARAWGELMARLGYDRYGAQGGTGELSLPPRWASSGWPASWASISTP